MSWGRKFYYVTGLIIVYFCTPYGYSKATSIEILASFNFQWRIQDMKKGGATTKELLSGKLFGIVCDTNYTLFVTRQTIISLII